MSNLSDQFPSRSLWRHYKGGVYRYITLAQNCDTRDWLVVYQAENGKIWTRPVSEWFEAVEVDGKTQPRFELEGSPE